MKQSIFWKTLVAVLLAVLTGYGALVRGQNADPARAVRVPSMRRNAIEGRFESPQAKTRPELGGAVPGARLLASRRQSAVVLRGRAQARASIQSSTVPAGTALPGILMRPSLRTGALPTSVVTGDFDRDGRMDFVVANGLDNDLWFYAGKGDGTFQLPRVVPLSKGLSPVNLAVADTRGNGKLDIVVAEFDTSSIGVLLGNGDGTFGYEQIYTLPEPPAALVVDDFNHDGKPDVAVAMPSLISGGPTATPYIALLTGDGAGGFSGPAITFAPGFVEDPWTIASGDLNNDGLPDLLITGPMSDNASAYLNNGDGTFRPGGIAQRNDPGAYVVMLGGVLADVDGDHCVDAILADVSSNVWYVPGDCTGHFKAPRGILVGDSAAAVQVTDVNGDGNPDIVTASLPALSPAFGAVAGNTLTVSLGDGKGNFGAARLYAGAGQAYSIGVADFNGDGFKDFVTANNEVDSVSVFTSDATGDYGFPKGVWAGVPGQGVIDSPLPALSFADLNSDGKTDCFFIDVGYAGEYYATSLLNDGKGRFSGPIATRVGTTQRMGDYRLGDFRNTGHPDMVAVALDAAFSSAQFILFLAGNGDGTFTTGTPVTTTGADGVLATGDFNHDGKLDFVAVDGEQNHTLRPFFGNGDGTFRSGTAAAFSDTSGVNATRVYSGDFNRDGKLDVLVFTTGNGYWTTDSTVWEIDGNGDGTFQAARQLYTGFQPFDLADVNGDGHPDIARYDFMWPDGTTETPGPAKFTTYLGQADGAFAQSSSYAPYAGAPVSVKPYEQFGDPGASSLVADLNGDGKGEEIAFQNLNGTYAQILMGNGDGTFTPTYDVFPFSSYGYPAYAHDLDGDGVADLVEVDEATSGLRVYKGGKAPALQLALDPPLVTGTTGCGWVFPDVPSASDRTATLTSSLSGLTLPPVTVPANALQAKFCFSLGANYDWRQVFDVTAHLDGDSATDYGFQSYVLGFAESVSPAVEAPVYEGHSAVPVLVSLTSSQGYSSTAKLSCPGLQPGDSCKFAVTTLGVSPGAAASTTVTLQTAPDAAYYGPSHPFTILADDGAVQKRQTVVVPIARLSVALVSPTLQAVAGGSAQTPVTILGIPPYQTTCSGLPAGVTCSMSGTETAYPNPTNLIATLTIADGVPAGHYPFQINTTSGTESASSAGVLDVVDFSLAGPGAASDWVVTGTTQTVPITLQGSSNWSTPSGAEVTCTTDIPAASCYGGPASLSSATGASGIQIATPATAATGQYHVTVTATFLGHGKSLTFPIYVADFSGTLSATTLRVVRGGNGSLTATLTATQGFTSTVTLGCNAPSQIICSFSPSSTQLTGGAAQPVNITIAVGTSAKAVPLTRFSGRSAVVLAGLIGAWLLCGARTRARSVLLCVFVGTALLTSTGACGGGGGGSSSGGGSTPGTFSVGIGATAAGTPALRTLGTITVTVP